MSRSARLLATLSLLLLLHDPPARADAVQPVPDLAAFVGHARRDRRAASAPGGGWTFAPAAHGSAACLHAGDAGRRVVAAPVRLRALGPAGGAQPGTPAAGLLLLAGHRLTGKPDYLAAARRAGEPSWPRSSPSGGWFSEMPVEGARLLGLVPDGSPCAPRSTTTSRPAPPASCSRCGSAPATRATVTAAERGHRPAGARAAAVGGVAARLAPALAAGGARVARGPPQPERRSDARSSSRRCWSAAAVARPPRAGARRRDGAASGCSRVQQPPPRAGLGAAVRRRGTAGRHASLRAAGAGVVGDAARGRRARCPGARDGRGALVRRRCGRGGWLRSAAVRPGCWARFYGARRRPAALSSTPTARASRRAADARPGYDWQGDFGIAALLRRLALGEARRARLRRCPAIPARARARPIPATQAPGRAQPDRRGAGCSSPMIAPPPISPCAATAGMRPRRLHRRALR